MLGIGAKIIIGTFIRIAVLGGGSLAIGLYCDGHGVGNERVIPTLLFAAAWMLSTDKLQQRWLRPRASRLQ